MLLTYPSSFVNISSVLFMQPYNISVTIPHCCSDWSALTNLGKKKHNEKVRRCISGFFSSLMTNLRIYGSKFFGMTTLYNHFLGIGSEGVIPKTKVNILRTSHERKTITSAALQNKFSPSLNKTMVSKYILARFALLSIQVS